MGRYEPLPVSWLGTVTPTRGDDWRLMGATIREVLTEARYVLLALVGAVVVLTLFVVSQHQNTVMLVVVDGRGVSVGERLHFLFDLFPFVGPAYGPVRAGLLVAVSALIGLNIALVGYQIAELGLVGREGVLGAFAFLLGTVGAGCAACGSAVLVGILSLFGITGALTFLPFEGMEFLILSILGLVLSIFSVTKAIASDAACPVNF